jgi:hypothetical protein
MSRMVEGRKAGRGIVEIKSKVVESVEVEAAQQVDLNLSRGWCSDA